MASLVLILPKTSGYVKAFKIKDKSNKLMPFLKDDDKLLEKHKTIWTNIEDLKNIELNHLPVYDYRYIKTQMRRYGKRVYIYFHGLHVPEDDIKCESFTAISIDSLLI